jgi:LacI family transcriptional regulator
MQKVPKVLLAIETSRSYGRGLLRGIFQYSRIHGPWMFLQNPYFYRNDIQTSSALPSSTLPYIKSTEIDGVIMRDEKNLDEIKSLKLPVILASYVTERPGLACIQTDCPRIGKLAAEHFIERGFCHFAYCGLKGLYWSDLRRESFRATIERAGYQVRLYRPPRLKKDCIWPREQDFLVEWLKVMPHPVGIFACNDERARDVIESCTIAGLRVPEDAAVLGTDNDELVCEMAHVPISSVALNVHRAGYQAAELLDKMMKEKTYLKTRIAVQPNRVVVRHSTDMLAIEDSSVAKAIKFIRQQVRKPIQVTDVADAVALSRRALYEKFQSVLGCSVHQYIKSMRVEEIARLLVESDVNISKIAFLMGFASEDHIAQYFRKHKGINPSEYRKQFVP